MQKEWKQMIRKKRFLHSWLWQQKQIVARRFRSIRKQNLLDSLSNVAELQYYKFFLQLERLRLHFLEVQDDPWKIFFTVTWRNKDRSTFTNCLTFLQPKNLWITVQEGIWATVFTESFWNCCNFSQKPSDIHNEECTGREYPWKLFSKEVDHSHLTMEYFSLEFVSEASAQLIQTIR